jgi:hypothetical protein
LDEHARELVARMQAVIEITELFQAFRLDDPASAFRRDLPAIPVMGFLAGDPDQYVTPLGAPPAREPQVGLEAASPEVRAAAYAMVAAAESAGLDPNTYRKEIAPWPTPVPGSPPPTTWRFPNAGGIMALSRAEP